MRYNQTWIAFLACITLVVMWFSINTSYKVYQWGTQTRHTHPIHIEWSVEQQARDRFALVANYTFRHQGNTVDGKTVFQTKRYKSPQAADHFLEKQTKKEWAVWYSAFQPRNSTIDRYFPLKSCLYTAIVWGILLYFIWLGYYVRERYR